MSDAAELATLLRHAFPRIDGRTLCAFCGRDRKRDHALCRECWFGLSARKRRDYMALDLEGRARMLLAILDGTEQRK